MARTVLPTKLEAVLARLCEKAGPLTKTKAVKLPYLVDVVASHVLGRRITEGTHQTWDYGVVTREIFRFITYHPKASNCFKVESHAYSEGGQQIQVVAPSTTRTLDARELAIVDLVAEAFSGLGASELGILTKSMNVEFDKAAWGENHEALVDEDAYARLSQSWQNLFQQAPSLDFSDSSQWGTEVVDVKGFVRSSLREA